VTNILKELRLKRGYTQEYMAEQLGYSDKTGYNKLENGNVKLSIARAIKASKVLKVNPSIFFKDEVQDTSTKEDIS